MSLSAGTRIGAYEITGQLGAGGMGEVYRARDTKLNRDVALKVLPDSFATDADRLARFTREAQTLAALNHPHIAAIYGIEDRALVMELVDGEDLSQGIARGAIPIDEALLIARQIAEALEAAHEQGIIHRDLKPANIKVRADGTVKVLDFGLAKLGATGAAGATADAVNSPTLSIHATQAGMILGTAAYMSPEQARGKIVDQRADIWAFGAVLFEMLSGKRAFDDEDVSLTLSKVLQREPDFDALPPSVPPRVIQTLRLCLRKDPKQRVADIRDVRLALEGAFESAAPQTVGPIAAPAPRPRLPWAIAATTTAIAVAALAFLYSQKERPAAESPTFRFEIDGGSGTGIVSVSPDGRRIVTTGTTAKGSTSLMVRSLDQLNSHFLPGTDGAAVPFWSPDGRFVAFFADRKLKKVDLLGAPPQTLCDAPVSRGGTWNRDGVILFGSANRPIQRVSASGGPPQPVTEIDKSRGEIEHRGPFFLPDGNHFLFVAASATLGQTALFVGSLDSKNRTLVMTTSQGAVFAPPHHLLFLRGSTLLAQEFDPNQLRLRGDPVPVAERVQPFPGSFSLSDTGILAHRLSSFGDADERQLSTVDRSGKRIEALATLGLHQNPVLSPNQQLVAFNRADQSNDIWIEDLNRRTTTRLTFDPGADDFPVWSPDGARIVFSSDRDGGMLHLYEKQSGGSGQEQLLLKTGQPKMATDWSRDGRYIIYTETDPTTSADIWLLPLFGDRKPVEYLRTPFNETQARVSPDGRWLAYRSDESGSEQVYVQSFPQAGSKWQVSSDGGRQPYWRGDGKELFYLSPTLDDQFMSVDILSTPSDETFKAALANKLFVINVLTGVGAGGQSLQRNSYDVFKDGQRLLLNSYRGAVDARPTITVVLNWASGLK